jgi:hypothetical protein
LTRAAGSRESSLHSGGTPSLQTATGRSHGRALSVPTLVSQSTGRESEMIESSVHLYLQTLQREVRELQAHRPRFDRPEQPRTGRLGRLVRALGHSPAQAARVPGKSVPKVTIRPARAADLGALTRLADLSERRLPTGLVLVAEVESAVVAALPVEGGPLLSDLWRPTGDVAQLLELRTEQLRAAARARRAA